MANCRACTAKLPDGAAVCPACDEPVAKKKKKAKKPAPEEGAAAEPPEGEGKADGEGEGEGDAAPPENERDSEKAKAETMPSNDAMLSLTAGIASCAFALLPCLFSPFWAFPATGFTALCGAFAVWKGTTELRAIEEGTAPRVGEKASNIGRMSGFAGAGLAAVMLVTNLVWTYFLARLFHGHGRR